MFIRKNSRHDLALPELRGAEARLVTDAGNVARLLAECPAARPTPLVDAAGLAEQVGIAALHLKDERTRMGLGSFKALGAAYAIAADAEEARANDGSRDWATALAGTVYVAASAGNHGLSVAAGARVFGAAAVIFLAGSVPETFAERLRGKGARVERAGAIYEETMQAAADAAVRNGWILLSDSSWPGYLDRPRRITEGYLQMAAEAADALAAPPTHIFLQAGVGGMAAAVAAHARDRWADGPFIVVVEPEAAPALMESARAGRVVETFGPVSAMGRLDCKVPSLLALAALVRDADVFATIGEDEAARAVARLAGEGLVTTPSGGAGVAALLACGPHREALGLTGDSRVLAFLTEGSETP